MNDTAPKTPLEICNLALAKLGEKPITKLNRFGTRAESHCEYHYHVARREILCANKWPFATRTATIPSADEGYRGIKPHTLPLDSLHLLEVSAPNWTLRGRTIWSPEDALNIVYIADEEDCTKFTPLFIEALATSIAAKLVKTIFHSAANSAKKAEQLTNAYQNLI